LLHSLHAGTTFPFVDLPPRMRGTICSIVSSFGDIFLPQKWQTPAAHLLFHHWEFRSLCALIFSFFLSSSVTYEINGSIAYFTENATSNPSSLSFPQAKRVGNPSKFPERCSPTTASCNSRTSRNDRLAAMRDLLEKIPKPSQSRQLQAARKF